jgi:hypothetical protein
MKSFWIRFGIIVLCLLIIYFIVDKPDTNNSIEFTQKLDSLQKVNNSLILQNKASDSLIAKLVAQDTRLNDIINAQKSNIESIRKVVVKEVEVIKNADSTTIVKFYNQRYPNQASVPDTPLTLNKPVLVEAAADLIKYDGAVKEIAVKDSIITTQDTRINLKDSTITLYKAKEINLNTVINNKDLTINEWTNQYRDLQLQNNRLKKQTKTQKIIGYALTGGLLLLLIVK